MHTRRQHPCQHWFPHLSALYSHPRALWSNWVPSLKGILLHFSSHICTLTGVEPSVYQPCVSTHINLRISSARISKRNPVATLTIYYTFCRYWDQIPNLPPFNLLGIVACELIFICNFDNRQVPEFDTILYPAFHTDIYIFLHQSSVPVAVEWNLA